MKPSYFILALLCAFSMAFVSCENNDPDTKKGGDDTTSQHQPANPATWSPVGHKYVSTDDSHYGRYLGAQINFLTTDTFYWDLFYEQKRRYRIEYPLVYIDFYETPQFKFIDTLTITKAYENADESSCYKLVR